MMVIGKYAVLTAAVCSLMGCSFFHRTKPPVHDDASAFVDGTVDPTIRSIDKSLQTLVILERGDESPRKPGAIGDTVAGVTPPKPPIAVSGRPGAADGGAAEARVSASRAALETRVRIQWKGSAEGLLKQLGEAMSFRTYSDGPAAAALKVSVSVDNATVEEVLKQVAHQIHGKADVRVDTAARTLRLVRTPPPVRR